MKSFFIKSAVFTLLAFTAFSSEAANEIGNGGDALVCNDGSVELLDVFEARSRGIILEGTNVDPQTHALKKLHKLAEISTPERDSAVVAESVFSIPYIWAEAGHDALWRNLEFVSSDFSFPDPTDRGSIHGDIPKECQILRIAHFEVEGKIFVKKYYFDKMDGLNQSALYLHELLYRGLRMGEDVNQLKQHDSSEMVRHLVGELLSSQVNLPQRFTNFPNTDDRVAICKSYEGGKLTYAFFLYQDSKTSEYRGEYFIDKGQFRYTANNRALGDTPKKFTAVFENMCKFLDGTDWHL
jgi:hypothetical protein